MGCNLQGQKEGNLRDSVFSDLLTGRFEVPLDGFGRLEHQELEISSRLLQSNVACLCLLWLAGRREEAIGFF